MVPFFRKAYSMQTCLSTEPHPQSMKFDDTSEKTHGSVKVRSSLSFKIRLLAWYHPLLIFKLFQENKISRISGFDQIYKGQLIVPRWPHKRCCECDVCSQHLRHPVFPSLLNSAGPGEPSRSLPLARHWGGGTASAKGVWRWCHPEIIIINRWISYQQKHKCQNDA